MEHLHNNGGGQVEKIQMDVKMSNTSAWTKRPYTSDTQTENMKLMPKLWAKHHISILALNVSASGINNSI